MSQDFMDPEIFADFIVEAREHLESIEPNLLELEKSPDNLSLLNEIFRPMHSLKGASGFLGLTRINALAHKAENILDELRKGTMSLTPEIMDVILSATDALRHMIDNLEATNSEGDVDIDSIIATIDAIMAAPAGESQSASINNAAQLDTPSPKTGEEDALKASDTPLETEETAKNDDAAEKPKELSQRKRDPDAAEKWLNSLKTKPKYSLSAFGESHLKDFIDEARENTEDLTAALLSLEDVADNPGDQVNDIFRFFHNLKGNSGIIGYNELNALTHEAETLLNNVRKGEVPITPELVDILLLVVDVIDTCIDRIDPPSGTVEPLDLHELEEKLRIAAEGKGVTLPFDSASASAQGLSDAKQSGSAPASTQDYTIFKDTFVQQKNAIDEAMEQLSKDSSQRDVVDALYRSLIIIQNSCKYMNFEEARSYAALTANLVDQGRKSNVDFAVMLDILKQEFAILFELVEKAFNDAGARISAASDAGNDAKAEPAQSDKDGASLDAIDSSSKTGKPAQAAAQTAKPASDAAVSAKSAQEPAASTKAPAVKAQGAAAEGASSTSAAPGKPPSAAKAPARPTNAPVAAKKDEGHKGASTIRVDHEKLDHLMNLIGELIINRNRYSMLARQLESNSNVDIGQVAQNLSETTYAMARISDDLQDTIMKVRMVPVSSVFSRFPRLVRDLSRKSGKDVELIMEGEETELDKSVVEVIGDPLVHLIRNSMDHGIEEESVRIANGKSPKGTIYLRAYHRGHSVAIEVEDDGKGIDPEKMREVAVRKGILTAEEAKALDDHEAVELIFAPGFSSAEKITDISGRGVGMDVVRTNIKNLKGSVSTSTELGKGTRFTLSLPLTLAIIDALMVNVAGQVYAIPLDAVSETTKIEACRLTDVKGRKAVTLRGEVLGIVDLSELLNLPSTMKEHDVLSVVVIHDNERRMGLVVDSLLERQEIVIKPLGEYLGDLKGISGATILGDGSVILILDPHEIYLMATSKAL